MLGLEELGLEERVLGPEAPVLGLEERVPGPEARVLDREVLDREALVLDPEVLDREAPVLVRGKVVVVPKGAVLGCHHQGL